MSEIKKGTLFVIAAPSGTGKTSLVKALVGQVDNLSVSISYTTRPTRSGEVDGEAYYFIDEDEFKVMIKQERFLEYAKVYDNHYGTPQDWVEEKLANGENIILEIDWQGAQQVKSLMRGTVGIFVLPPSYETLKQRLIDRQNDDVETISRRISTARDEISHYKDFDYVVINDDFDTALEELKIIIRATDLGRCRQSAFYDDFVEQMIVSAD